MQEIWKDIKGYEGIYQISDHGNLKALNYRRSGTVKQIKPYKSASGYYRVDLSNNGIHHRYFLHKLVAQIFIENNNQYPEVNHKDENKLNNNATNLEWCTRQYNLHYGTRIERMANGLKRPVIGVHRITGDMLYFNSLKKQISRDTIVITFGNAAPERKSHL